MGRYDISRVTKEVWHAVPQLHCTSGNIHCVSSTKIGAPENFETESTGNTRYITSIHPRWQPDGYDFAGTTEERRLKLLSFI